MSSQKNLPSYFKLSGDEDDSPESYNPDSLHFPPTSKSSIFSWKAVAILEFLVIVAVAFFRFTKTDGVYPTVYSPAGHVIEYEVKTFSQSLVPSRTPFQGPPSPEMDMRWHDLYGVGISTLSKSEADRLPNKTSVIPGEPGHYIASLTVFHHLHCINSIRQTLYPDYYPHMSLKNQTMFEHIEHCVDIIRQAIMCNPDISTMVWQWDSRANRSIAALDVVHSCRNFDKIKQWAEERVVDAYDEKVWVEGNPIRQLTIKV
ncbi:hypothetical protein BDQ17DRAFT_1372190 [Cyathus striatus]|nr:hypothetical protein BDQ17DRAFT_1372190 [Cyathus striatus]